MAVSSIVYCAVSGRLLETLPFYKDKKRYINICLLFSILWIAYFDQLRTTVGTPGGAVVWGTALQAGRLRVRFTMVSSFRSHYGPGANLASYKNEYQEYFLGVKVAGA
jgi:hypothetical protein